MDGVPAIQGELNPAAWMLDITTPGMEHQLGVDFAQVYKDSDLARCMPSPFHRGSLNLEACSHAYSITSSCQCSIPSVCHVVKLAHACDCMLWAIQNADLVQMRAYTHNKVHLLFHALTKPLYASCCVQLCMLDLCPARLYTFNHICTEPCQALLLII